MSDTKCPIPPLQLSLAQSARNSLVEASNQEQSTVSEQNRVPNVTSPSPPGDPSKGENITYHPDEDVAVAGDNLTKLLQNAGITKEELKHNQKVSTVRQVGPSFFYFINTIPLSSFGMDSRVPR